MQVVVINKRSAGERRELMRAQLACAGIEFEFADALTDRDIARSFHHYDDAEYRLNNGRAAIAGELACFASHRALWQRSVDTGDALVVLEDDARIRKPFKLGLGVLESVIDDLGFIRIEPLRNRRMWRERQVDGFALGYCGRVPLCTTGYVISPRAARKLVDASGIVGEPVDKFVQRFWRHDQPVYAVAPALVDVHEAAGVSTIGERAPARPSPALRLRRILRKSENSVCRELYNVRHFLHAALRGTSLPRVKSFASHHASVSLRRDERAKISGSQT